MPYHSQGIETTESCKRLELSYLFKHKLIQKNSKCSFTLTWNNRGEQTGSIGIETVLNDSEKYIRLIYSVTNKEINQRKDFDYNINLVSVKSNLGIGDIYYFQCPVSLQKCRILYLAYGSETFKSRNAYRQRIYYNLQTISKNWYSLQRYFDLEKKIESLYYLKKYFKESYRGHKTKSFYRKESLIKKLNYFDTQRLFQMQNSLNKLKGIDTLKLAKFL